MFPSGLGNNGKIPLFFLKPPLKNIKKNEKIKNKKIIKVNSLVNKLYEAETILSKQARPPQGLKFQGPVGPENLVNRKDLDSKIF